MARIGAGTLAVEVDTGRPLRVLSDPTPGPPVEPELLGLSRGAREQVEQHASRRGCSLRVARVALGWKPAPPMWGDDAAGDEPVLVVEVVGSRGAPHWRELQELAPYADWYRRQLALELQRERQLQLW